MCDASRTWLGVRPADSDAILSRQSHRAPVRRPVVSRRQAVGAVRRSLLAEFDASGLTLRRGASRPAGFALAKASRGINGRLTPRRKHDVSDRVPARRHVEIGFTTVRLDPTILCGYCACPFRSCADTVRVLSVLRVLSVPCPFRSFRSGYCPTINDRHLLITRSTRRMSEKDIARRARWPYDGRWRAWLEDRPGRGIASLPRLRRVRA